MTSKTLSTSTLSLRFMQNAHRAKQLKEVELDRAEVQDDGKWEVSKAVRDAWGLSNATTELSSDVHEASYLPFLFPHHSGDSLTTDELRTKTTGRRVFNKKGEEVGDTPPDPETEASPPKNPEETSSKGRKVHPRPITISATGNSGKLLGFEGLKAPKSSKSAREAIFENSGVGTDLRTQARSGPATSQAPPPMFMKPGGVDDPKDVQITPKPASMSASPKVIDGSKKKRVKREQEGPGEEPNPSKRPKRSKKPTLE